MNSVRASAPQLADITPYDPKYLPARAYLSANENPCDVETEVRNEIKREINKVAFNRYPDPLANELRDMIAEANGLDRDCVLVGNGGDELLFDLALAWGGPGRKFLNMPPTFSVYQNNAELTNTEVVDIPRRADYTIDEEAVLSRVARGDIDYVIVTSPNNPTGDLADERFILRLLDATDALVMVDEAYFEFSRGTVRPYLAQHKNLVILRTFSKAFSLAGVRVGYLLGNPEVIREFLKVRQPYSVDAVSQAIARVVREVRARHHADRLGARARVPRAFADAGHHGVPLECQLHPVPRRRRGGGVAAALRSRHPCARFQPCAHAAGLPAGLHRQPRGERRVPSRALGDPAEVRTGRRGRTSRAVFRGPHPASSGRFCRKRGPICPSVPVIWAVYAA